MSRRIDFNCDLGEGCGDDAAILPWVSSANIACGGHAGDEATMRATLRLCRAHGVSAGAHPSFDDREHFGRRALTLPATTIAQTVRAQIERLAAIAAEEGVPLTHVKPHGALYNVAADDRGIADAIAETVRAFDPSLVLFGLSGSALTDAGSAHGLRVAHEAFAERGYDRRGRLLPRGSEGAVIESLDAAIVQVRRLATRGEVVAADGSVVPLRADTLCLHGDRSDAAVFARAVRDALEADGIVIAAVGSMSLDSRLRGNDGNAPG
ncbi:LamB/YcsF family protein [Lysobacter sp. S4-A87]|uniref:5-oxoprolinase subunit PxpA n=1 Tax=Lysobacter sp. S4-A87 TaxID=2925843 RepID=UPI001F52E767|nr:5-oxoprolinase subunit PxpA [Lysobacter sp. S4-A87]UNK50226.1 LamB/YcsF family protein [Lysobacter sp. S4-A87]